MLELSPERIDKIASEAQKQAGTDAPERRVLEGAITNPEVQSTTDALQVVDAVDDLVELTDARHLKRQIVIGVARASFESNLRRQPVRLQRSLRAQTRARQKSIGVDHAIY